jgi:hypothetical protein
MRIYYAWYQGLVFICQNTQRNAGEQSVLSHFARNSTLQAVRRLVIEMPNSLSNRSFVCMGCLSIVQKVATA